MTQVMNERHVACQKCGSVVTVSRDTAMWMSVNQCTNCYPPEVVARRKAGEVEDRNQMNNGAWPQAFPQLPSTGMSLRDWFAGQVIAGNWDDREDALLIAKGAYVMADAMLEARKV